MTDLKVAADPCKTLLATWLAQYYTTESCGLTNFLELDMLLISVSGSAKCAGCAYEAQFFSNVFSNFREIVG